MNKEQADETLMWNFVEQIKRRQQESKHILNTIDVKRAMFKAIKIIEKHNLQVSHTVQEAKP